LNLTRTAAASPAARVSVAAIAELEVLALVGCRRHRDACRGVDLVERSAIAEFEVLANLARSVRRTPTGRRIAGRGQDRGGGVTAVRAGAARSARRAEVEHELSGELAGVDEGGEDLVPV